jgi:hypothetical protein
MLIKSNAAERLKKKLEQKKKIDQRKQEIKLFDPIAYSIVDYIEGVSFETNYLLKEKNFTSNLNYKEITTLRPKDNKKSFKVPKEQEVIDYIIAKTKDNPADILTANRVKTIFHNKLFSGKDTFFKNYNEIVEIAQNTLSDKNFCNFEEKYHKLNDALADSLTEGGLQYASVFFTFFDLGVIFLRQYEEEVKAIDNSAIKYNKTLNLLAQAYKYFYYALDRLRNDKDTLTSVRFINSEGQYEIKDFALKEILLFDDNSFNKILILASEAFISNDLKDIDTKKCLINIILQSLEAKKMLVTFLKQENIDDAKFNESLLENITENIANFKKEISQIYMKDVENQDFINKVNKKYSNEAAHKIAKTLIAEEEKERELKKLAREKSAAKMKNNKSENLIINPKEESEDIDDSEENVIPKQELSQGEKNLEQGRKLLNSVKDYYSAIPYFIKARSLFIEAKDIENELQALTGIADSKLCLANKYLKDAVLKNNRLNAPDILKEAQKLFLQATEQYKEIIKLTTITNIKEIYYINVKSCQSGLEKISDLIEFNTRYLKESKEKYQEICKDKKIKLALKHLMQEEIPGQIYKLLPSEPIKFNHNAHVNNTLSLYMNNTAKQFWDLNFLFMWFNQFLLDGFEFSPEYILRKGDELWKNNPKYKGMDKKDFLEIIKNQKKSISQEMLKKYTELEQENIIIKEKIDLIKNEIELIKIELQSLQHNVTSATPTYLALENPWNNQEKLKIIKSIDHAEISTLDKNFIPINESIQGDLGVLGSLENESHS